jgi:hypothetical protein
MMGLLDSPIQYPMKQLSMLALRFQGSLQEPLHQDQHIFPRLLRQGLRDSPLDSYKENHI